MKDDVIRSRTVREAVLTSLWLIDGAGADLGLSFEQLHRGFRTSRLEVSSAELRRDLGDLEADGLVTKTWDEQLEVYMYRLGKEGRDFLRAGMPWREVDRYTGRNSTVGGGE